MKNIFTLLMILGSYSFSYAQGSVGLIAHWNMNGSANDVSGNGHDGTATNVTPAMGMDGVMGDAYYFNGVNSVITVPYSSAFNLTEYSISTTIQVMGYYTGLCQMNLVFGRGKTGTGIGNYSLFFNDKAGDGYGCTTYDTTVEVFQSVAETLAPVTEADFYYTPAIIENQWYNVVITFNDTAYKTYINGTLVATAAITTPGVLMGASTDGINIGYNTFEAAAGYPYPFNGVIDDMKLFGTALTDSEVVHVNDTCGSITLQPVDVNVSSEALGAIYTVNSSIAGATYQWQGNSGTGFVNLSNAGPYSGVTTPTLTVVGSSALNNDIYRCLVSNSWGCSDTSSSAVLTVGLGVGNVLSNGMLCVFPNPAETQLTLQSSNLPIQQITISNILGQVIYNRDCNSLYENIDISGFPVGVYFIKVNNIEVRKFVKE